MILGRNSYFLGTDKADNTIIGNFSSVAGGTYIHSADNHACVDDRKLVSTFPFHTWDENYPEANNDRQTVIGSDVWIGEYVSILSGVKIGNGVIVGAHSVIAKDIPSYAVVVGNPAVIKRFRFTENQIKALEKIKWWEWDNGTIRSRLEDFRNIDTFIEKYKI